MSLLKEYITGPHLETKKCSPHIAKLIQTVTALHESKALPLAQS